MNRVETSFMQIAYKFDQVSESMINSKMCTTICPCRTETDLSVPPPDELVGSDPRATYW